MIWLQPIAIGRARWQGCTSQSRLELAKGWACSDIQPDWRATNGKRLQRLLFVPSLVSNLPILTRLVRKLQFSENFINIASSPTLARTQIFLWQLHSCPFTVLEESRQMIYLRYLYIMLSTSELSESQQLRAIRTCYRRPETQI